MATDMKSERLLIAQPDIVKFFQQQTKIIFRRADLAGIQLDQSEYWRLAPNTTIKEFIQFLLEQTPLLRVDFRFSNRVETLYTWGTVSTYRLLQNIRPDSYFTHFTAMYMHQLTDQVPRTIYVNFEQAKKKRGDSSLAQDRIDFAFRRPARISKNITEYKDRKVCLLNGMYTGRLGVIEMEAPDREQVDVTNVERTLIDIAVRPSYAGGVFEILKAYKLARERVSINKLAAILKTLDYVYPYHQVIGFYLDKAGVYDRSQIDLLRKVEMKYDFYLTHGMKETDYSAEWRLFFPKGF